MSRVEQLSEGVRLICGDCREILPTLGKVDAVVTDPPYGIGRDKGNKTRHGSGFYAVQIRKQYADDWDYRPDDATLSSILALGDASIIWGGNYFSGTLPENGRWLVWDKQNTMPTFSDCELAWTNLPQSSVKMLRYSNNGLMAAEKGRVHPTQKPVEVMRWCIGFMPTSCTICDPFMGSGTTGVACVQLDRCFIGIEINETYFDIACRRIANELSRPRLRLEPIAKPTQEAMSL